MMRNVDGAGLTLLGECFAGFRLVLGRRRGMLMLFHFD
jgi:hypothetical protein